ncbi:YciI family protein [Oceanibaculum pacificum]|uniref:YCII-related domain-containing protein n=1 Tax=Oceanibaculum pacificum TaxID=580166 RepID=A0A154VYE4_9PROT|nr:YciI family protein [Oceanibaculum pacificum]KZD06270.1 hypothetical protein AUP43_10980 [Oceanibaculum pacificum]
MLFSIVCRDKPNSVELRMATRPTHLEYLKARTDNILVGGPVLGGGANGEEPTGSHLIVEAPDLAAAKKFADDDPYALAGLFESVDIRPWRKVFFNASLAE